MDEELHVWTPMSGIHRPREPHPAWFAGLIALLADPPATETLDGIVSACVLEPAGAATFRYRVRRRGALVRCENRHGQVHYLAGRERVWLRADGTGGVRSEARRADGWFPIPDDYEFGARRPGAERWEGDDFTLPTGPPRRVTFLGRDALEVELAPPPHKPHPMQLVVDASSGLVLCERNEHLGTYHEWSELRTDVVLPDELFAWADTDEIAPRDV